MSAQPTAIESLTVCKVCHQAVSFGPPIIGERDDQKAQRYIAILQRHIDSVHFRQSAQVRKIAETFAETFRCLMIVQAFDTADQFLLAAYDATRAPIHALTRKHTLSDAQLQALIAEGMPPNPFSKQIANAALPIAQKIRDILSEQGEYEHPIVKQAREAQTTQVTA